MPVVEHSETGETGDLEIEVAGGDTEAAPEDAGTRWLYRVTGAAAALSIVTAAILAVVHHWVPLSDNAVWAIRAHDVFSTHAPLVGPMTSASLSTGVYINNPGPLYFDVIALPTAIFGSTNAGVAIGAAVVNLLCALGIGIVARRQGGYVVGAAAFTIVAVLAWALGSEVLVEPIQPGALLLPALLLMVLSWGVARDDLVLLPWLVGVASFILQTYVTYVYIILILCGWAVACMLLRLHAQHYERAAVRRVRNMSLIALVVGVVCWFQPVYQQFFGDSPGNISQLWKALQAPSKSFGVRTGTRVVADVVSLPPFWFRPSFHDFLEVRHAPASSLPVAVVTLLVVAGVLALIARAARRDTLDVTGTLAATALVALLAGIITGGRMPIGLFGVTTSHVFRWLWPLAAFVTFAFLIAVIHSARHRVRPTHLVAGLAVIASVFAVLNIPTSDQNPDTITDSFPAARDITRQLAVLEGRGPLVFDTVQVRFADPYAIYVLAVLQHYGIDFKVNDQISLFQLGFRHRFDGTNANGALILRGGNDVDNAPAGSERVAVHYSLNPDERAEMATRRDEIAALMNDGTIALNEAGAHLVATHAIQAPPADPAALRHYVQSDDFGRLVHDKAVTLTPSARRTIDRYTKLHDIWRRQTVAVYLAPLADLSPPG
jgi:hypothetical protein